MLPDRIDASAVTGAVTVTGGDINRAYRCTLADDRVVFVKARRGAPAWEWQREAESLAWLSEPGVIAVPAVVEIGDAWLALEWVQEGGPPDPEALGRGLALLHRSGAGTYGAPWTYGFGDLVLGNEECATWAQFHAERRLLPLARHAAQRGAITPAAARDVESVCARLGDLIPAEPPARLHGDLWSGNVLGDTTGRPWLVDPAAHGGHREVDLAMLVLFGAPPARCLAAYDEVWPRTDGHAERVELFQLVPLLVHAVLFGGSYGASVARIARRYASRSH